MTESSPRKDVAAIVVPCFNEEKRLDADEFLAIAATGRVRLLFVDDGSTDGTAALLEHISAQSDDLDLLRLAANVGKAEAIRAGLHQVLTDGASVVGYYDADLATPPHELLRLVDVLCDGDSLAFVSAARVGLLGRAIERRAARHYLGRIFATLASLALGVRVYDTQCGAKVFRVSPAVVEALASPFRSSWAFDVELFGRLLHPRASEPIPIAAFYEVPLHEWRDVDGSSLGLRKMAGALLDLMAIGLAFRRRRRSVAER